MSLNLRYAIREGFRGLGRARVATTLTISTIALTMLVSGVLGYLILLIRQGVGGLSGRIAVEAFLSDHVGQSESDIRRLEEAIQTLPPVESVRYVSKEEAMRRFKEAFQEDVLELLGENPLPSSFEIRLRPGLESLETIEALAHRIEAIEGVDEVVYHKNLIRLIQRYRRTFLLVATGVVFFVALVAVLLVANTLRLTLTAQARTIEIMKLVGAFPGFIRRPFVIQGLLQAGIGGAIASLLLWGLVTLFDFQYPHLIPSRYPYWLFPFLVSLCLGYLGSEWSLAHFFKKGRKRGF